MRDTMVEITNGDRQVPFRAHPQEELMPDIVQLSNVEARRFLLSRQGLWPPRALQGPAGVKAVFKRLECVQYDPLNAVGRNADLVLQSRVADYRSSMLYELAYEKRVVYDYWDKMAAYIPVRDWPSFELRRRYLRDYHSQWRAEHAQQIEAVVQVVRDEGPKCSLDFKLVDGDEGKTAWRWGRMKVAKAALEMLWDTGEMMVSRREGARRYYDLAENVLPRRISEGPLLTDDDTFVRWKAERRCRSIGLVGPALGGAAWSGVGSAAERTKAVAQLAEAGTMVPVRVEGDARTYHALAAHLRAWTPTGGADDDPKVAFVAPLDNLMWARYLVARLFGFEYVWEVYKPANQRKYGYYVLPVLYGDRFVARFEPKLDRAERTLNVLSWHWEAGEAPTKGFGHALVEATAAFMSYLGAERVEVSSSVDGKVAALLKSARPAA